MFMAILNDTYSEVKEDVENRKEDFQVSSVVSHAWNEVYDEIYKIYAGI